MRRAVENFVDVQQTPANQQVSLNPANESQDAPPQTKNSNNSNNSNNNNNNNNKNKMKTLEGADECACHCATSASDKAPSATAPTCSGKEGMKTCGGGGGGGGRKRQHPLDSANLLRRLFFVWMLPIIWRAHRRGLNRLSSDLPERPSDDERCQSIGQTLAANWRKELLGCNWHQQQQQQATTTGGRRWSRDANKRPSLLRAAARTHVRCIVVNSMLSFFAEVVCKSTSAYSVGQILFYINNRDNNNSSINIDHQMIETTGEMAATGWLISPLVHIHQRPLAFWTAALILSTCGWVLSAHYYGFQMMRVGLRLRVGCSYLIYLKSLRLGHLQSRQIIMGRMTNLLSNDLDKFNFVCIMLPFLWIGPLQTGLSLALLWPLLGPACLASLLVVLVVLLPIQFYLSDKFASFRQRIAQQTDQRIKLLNETISSIRFIKLYAWEMPFMRRLLASRRLETRLIQQVAIWKAFSVALMYVSSKMVLFITILFHCLLFGRPLEANTLFMSMAMLNNVQFTMTQLMPRVISLGGESLVSLRRMGEFLLQPELERSPKLWQSQLQRKRRQSTGARLSTCWPPPPSHTRSLAKAAANQSQPAPDANRLSPNRWPQTPISDHRSYKQAPDWGAFVHCQALGAHWPQAERKTLESVAFRCRAPELVAVCGQVGSGKSSLLLSLLNELPLAEGSAQICGQVAYSSQLGWIFNGTLRDNILFGRQFNEQRYRQTLEACALLRDLHLLEFGDQTYVHEEALSGGQRARVNLARCLYDDSSDIYLLDDPFSALDGRVAEQIFEEAIVKLLKDKLVLLATHQVRYLRRCDKILLLDEGKQLAYCTYLELGSMYLAPIGEHFTRRQHERLSFLDKCFSNPEPLDEHDANQCGEAGGQQRVVTKIGAEKNLNYFKLANQTRSGLKEDDSRTNQPKGEEESRQRSSSTGRAQTWFKYYSLNSIWRLIFIVLSFLVTQGLFSSVDIYLTVWSMIEQNRALLVEITESNQLWPNYIKHSLIHRAYDSSSTFHLGLPVNSSLVINYDNEILSGVDLNNDYDNNNNKSMSDNNNNNSNNNMGSPSSIYNFSTTAGAGPDSSTHHLDQLVAHDVNNNILAPMLDWLLYYSTRPLASFFEFNGNNISLIEPGPGEPEEGEELEDGDVITSDNVSVINLDDNILLESSQALNIKPIYRPLYLMIANLSPGQHAIIYASLLCSLFICSSITNILSLTTSNKSAKTLYEQLINSVMYARVSLFDQNPIGRFLNRATRDFGIIDEAIPYNANQAYDALLQTAATFLVVTIVDYHLALPSLLMLSILFIFHSILVAPTRDLQRLEGIARSPILTHISSTLNGLHTIRASRAQSRLEKAFVDFQDSHTSVMLCKLGCNRSTAVILDWFNAIYVAVIALVAVNSVELSGPSAGLIITSAILLSGLSQHGIMKLIETESLMTSVERVLEYCHLPEEEEPGRRNLRRPTSVITGQLNEIVWPNEGVIEYKNVYLYYHEHDRTTTTTTTTTTRRAVLKDLTFKTRPHERIGIIGRTGAGKSSIISTLFRLYPYEGLITLDGVDLAHLNLTELRNAIGIIPQNPTLFASLSVRENLDPRGEFDDFALWSALDKAHLRETISNLPGKLDFLVGEAGLSSGQKQLACLARVLLRQNKIIVLDEATASVDPTTDSIIQTLIREQFRHCTVLTIAHRLETILDCDRIMILDAGQLMEFDSPQRLAANRDSHFSKLMTSNNLR